MDETELLQEFVEEAREHLGDIEIQLLQIEAMGEAIDDNLVNTVFRAIHSIKGAAGFLGLTQINAVSHGLENVLGRIREKKLIPDPFNVDVMLKAADRLKNMIESIQTSNQTDNAELCGKLDALLDAPAKTTKTTEASATTATAATTKAAKAPTAKAAAGKTPRKTTRKAATGKTTTRRSPAQKAPSAPRSDMSATATNDATVAQRVEDGLNVADDGLNEATADAAATATATPASSDSDNSVASPVPAAKAKATAGGESTIRVGVRTLDRLMNLAGELVLSRNQLLQAIAAKDNRRGGSAGNLDTIASGLDQVTTELQETIMQTRMQPIGNVFNKFPRVIRDLSATLGKSIDLHTEGNEVETDKTIVEAIADPLTHLIRNSCDHGIERPEQREAAGKSPTGQVVLKAYHQAGKVIIEIIDDGAGIDPQRLKRRAVEKGILDEDSAKRMTDREAVNLIFAPGFSTAAVVTDVSGRGVGMDVVRTNIEKIGGTVEVTSLFGRGSTVRITLPLTLAIVPSMIVEVGGCRYALPQSGIVELVQTDGKEKCIQRANHAEVLRLRGSLLPLIRMRTLLGVTDRPDARNDANVEQVEHNPDDCQLVVVEAGHHLFAMAVDQVLDSEEIVVKPLGRQLANLPLLAGSTILGDGRVALILDVAGIASRMELAGDVDGASNPADDKAAKSVSDIQRMVLLSLSASDRFAVSMDIVSRIERVAVKSIETLGERSMIQYRGTTLPLIAINDVVKVNAVDDLDHVHVIVFRVYGHEVGLIAPHLHDICDTDLTSGVQMCRDDGIAGIAVIGGQSTRLLDVYGLTKIARPDWFDTNGESESEPEPARILICEDSAFFRTFLGRTLADEGHKIVSAEDGEEGWQILHASPGDFDMVVTDVEMPRLDGFGLTRRIRADGRFKNLPVIALTSLADEESTQRGREAGVDEYQVKMNKPMLLSSIQLLIQKRKGAPRS